MTELQKLEFDQISMLNVDDTDDSSNPKVDSSWYGKIEADVKLEDLASDKVLLDSPVFSSNKAYFKYGLNLFWPYKPTATHPLTEYTLFLAACSKAHSSPYSSELETIGRAVTTF